MSIEATERYLRTEANRNDGRQTCRVDKSALSALLDELSRLREALKPFAAAANCHSDDKEFMPDAMLIWQGGECTIRLGDLRRARALSEHKEGQDGLWPNWGDSPNGFDGPGGAE